ncbi:MAG: hypothetical protein E6Q26_06795 [Acinetobacter sp.]|nr:MAG: hypothetical protein E6Q26_06795 [Acinetobacter sp.]
MRSVFICNSFFSLRSKHAKNSHKKTRHAACFFKELKY